MSTHDDDRTTLAAHHGANRTGSGLSRRELLAASLTVPLIPGCASTATDPLPAPPGQTSELRVFRHGVASGDPDQESVVLWTRATPLRRGDPVQVEWSVYTDPFLAQRVARGSVTTSGRVDWTVRSLVRGLEPGRSYYYVFESQGERSPVGRTRTLPPFGVERMRIAFTSCSNLPFGYFNAYAAMAARNDLDLVLHLGDYIYEYADGEYGDGRSMGRGAVPPREIVSLADYRARYGSYRLDPDLQELHRQHPMIAVWDDHESANNSWRDGAQNHDAREGRWSDRKAAAVRAWHEWLPARSGVTQTEPRIWRSFRCGDLVDLAMLDTRLYGRDREASATTQREVIEDPSRTLLGPAQEAWLFDELLTSKERGTAWRILGQQVMFGQLGGMADQPILNTDQWDGYAHARRRVFHHLASNGIDDVVVLTGDIHSSWAMDLAPDPFGDAYDAATGRGSLAVEFVTPSVTSPGITSPNEADSRARTALESHPHMRYVELITHGYVLLDIDRERLQGEIWHVDTIDERNASERLASAWATARGANHLEAASGASPEADAREPAPG